MTKIALVLAVLAGLVHSNRVTATTRDQVKPLLKWIRAVDDPATADSAWKAISAELASPAYADSALRGFGWYLLSSAARALDDPVRMMQAAESSLTYRPRDPSGLRDLTAYLSRKPEYLERAEYYAKRVVDTPGRPGGTSTLVYDLNWMGHIQLMRRDTAAAITTFERALEMSQTSSTYAGIRLGRVYAARGRQDLAIERLARALAIFPPDSSSRTENLRLLDSLVTATGASPARTHQKIERDYAAARARAQVDALRDGSPVPRARFVDLATGKPAAFDASHGLAVVYAWATWCEPCRHSLPKLQAWAAKPRSKPVRVVTVNVDATPLVEARPAVTSFFAEQHLSLPVFFADSAIAKAWRVSGLPAVYVLSDGRVAYRGYSGDLIEGLEAQLASLGSRTPGRP